MASRFFDDFMGIVGEMKSSEAVSVDLLMRASSVLAAWLHAGGEHVAPVPTLDPAQVAAERALLEEKLAALKDA